MRISSLQIFNIANKSMSGASREMVHTQEQLSTGKRVLTPADDPVASTKIMQLTTDLANIDQYRKNIDLAENNLVAEESAMTSVGNLLQRIQELAVQAGNTATLSESEYDALAAEVDTRLDELLNLLNSQNANGDYIFGGYKSGQEPFSGTAASGFRYNGDEGQQYVKIANNTTIAASDSGKELFVDVESAENTIHTYTSSANTSVPGIAISVGEVIDQEAFDEFYPRDMVVSFNADNQISPAGKNYTITERTTGRIVIANQPYIGGNDIEVNGVRFRITGHPVSGEAALPSTRNFGSQGPVVYPYDFSPPANETFTVRVGGRTETLTLDGLVTNAADFVALMNSTGNGNAQILAELGVTVDATGFKVASGAPITLGGGSGNLNAVTGLTVDGSSTSADGVPGKPGDRVFIDSSNKQDVLTTLARFSEAMKHFDGSDESRESLDKMVGVTLDNLKNAQTSILDVTAKLGARYNTLESTRDLHLDTELVTRDVLGELRDLDYAEATTRLSAQSMILQAAQSTFIRVSQLNLFSQL
ncbi:flagellar hook-associated protein FlgL [Teredinibacter turnerae]|uniref:flagellar hook-associated protein FlgL n=1 Tax=Teredinibacter turnerae TaxID=2426 RepID=UPI00037B8A5C|nr:flagellar hook-associated protein FlgL [Teredinibacter turnerae]